MNSLILKKELTISENFKFFFGFNKFNRFSPSILVVKNGEERTDCLKLNAREWLTLVNFKMNIEAALILTENDDAIIKIGDISRGKSIYLNKSAFLEACIEVHSSNKICRFTLNDWNTLMRQNEMVNVFFLFANPMRHKMYKFYTEKYLPLCLRMKKASIETKALKKILPSKKEDKILHQLFCFEIERFLKTNVNNYIKKDIHKLEGSTEKDVEQNN